MTQNGHDMNCSSTGCRLVRDDSFHEVERQVTFSPLQKTGYFLSYNRYAILITTLSVVLPGAALWFFPWYVWIPVTLVALRSLLWAWQIARQYPKKLHITKKQLLALRNGSFQNEAIVRYCGDPCYRVVAHHVLAQALVPASERRKLVRENIEKAQSLSHAMVFVDHEHKNVVTVINGVMTKKPLTETGETHGSNDTENPGSAQSCPTAAG